MKLNKLFLFGLMAIAGLASCTNEDFPKGEQGHMKLHNVAIAEPAGTRANSAYTDEQLAAMPKATDYPIEIYDAQNNLVKRYETASQFPSEGIPMNVGKYTVESHTTGILQKKMTSPYYKGTEPISIQTGIVTDVDVVCKMQNSKIQVNYSKEFTDLYRTWTITIDDGSETALMFNNEDGDNPAPVYWFFEGDVESLTVQFQGILDSDGAPVTDTKVLSKDNFQRPYEDDNSQTFTGGDQLIFNFEPSEATTGEMGITLTATITFDETEESITVYLTDKALKDDEGGEGGDTPPVGDETPSLECTGGWNVSFSASEDEENLPLTEVVVKTPKGLKSLKVTVTGGNTGFGNATGFLQNLEIIGSEDLGDIFDGVDGAELPKTGDKLYKFPVYAFYSMIQMFGATDAGKAHEFYMVAEDMDGTVKDGTLKITVTQ
jgi:hypothetical protein